MRAVETCVMGLLDNEVSSKNVKYRDALEIFRCQIYGVLRTRRRLCGISSLGSDFRDRLLW